MANLNKPTTPGFALRDFHHAAKTFTQEPGYTKTPYTGFNFHVNISFNNLLGKIRGIETKDVSVLVKAADLPETQFETETLNQYNRKRIINKRVVYQPIKLEFHDDIANNIRNMWIAYNQHYNADSNYTFNSTWSIDDVYANYSLNRRYGLDNGNSLPFINKIEIFSMGNNEYSKMLLVNPMINSAQFDDHDYSESAKVMALTLTIEYENIIYSAGTTDQIANFGKNNTENYDQTENELTPADLSRGPLSNVSVRNVGGQANGIVENSRSSIPDTAIQSTTPTRQLQDSDSVTGNLSRIFSNSQTSSSGSSILNNSSLRSRLTIGSGQYSFPEASTSYSNTASRLGLASTSLLNESNNISSNGENVSSINVTNSNNTGISVNGVLPAVYTSVEQNTAELTVNPVIPDGLSPAEQQLFVNSFPPLPSTDSRASKPPYV